MDFIRRIYINGRGLWCSTEAGQCYCANLGPVRQSPTDSSDAHTRRMDTNMALLQGRVHEFYVSNRTQSAGQYIYQNVR